MAHQVRLNYQTCMLAVGLLMVVIMYMRYNPKECAKVTEPAKEHSHIIATRPEVIHPVPTDIKEPVRNIVSPPRGLRFDPKTIVDCKDIHRGLDKEDLKLPERYKEFRPRFEAVLKKNGGAGTGHVGLKPMQAAFFLDLVNNSFINTVCETGFNAGHSSMVWLTGNDKCKVYSFDLGGWRCSNPMRDFLKKEFPGRLTTIWGDSKKTVPAFTKKNPEVICDLIFVDGGHNYPEANADLVNLRAHANKNYHVLMADDYMGGPIKRSWKEEIKEGNVEEYFSCNTTKYIKWSVAVGKYINLP